MELSKKSLKNGRKKLLRLRTVKEIEWACKIEEVQSAVYRAVSEMVAKYGRQTVAEALEWVVDKLKPQIQVRSEESRDEENMSTAQ